MFSQTSEGHNGGKKNGQGKGHGNKSEDHVIKNLSQHPQFKPLSHEVIDVEPQELHHQYEKGNKKRKDEWSQVRENNVTVKRAHGSVKIRISHWSLVTGH